MSGSVIRVPRLSKWTTDFGSTAMVLSIAATCSEMSRCSRITIDGSSMRLNRSPSNSTQCSSKVPVSERWRSEEHTSELQSLMRISYAVFCLKKKKNNKESHTKPD